MVVGSFGLSAFGASALGGFGRRRRQILSFQDSTSASSASSVVDPRCTRRADVHTQAKYAAMKTAANTNQL
jgi:hypothetical protein